MGKKISVGLPPKERLEFMIMMTERSIKRNPKDESWLIQLNRLKLRLKGLK